LTGGRSSEDPHRDICSAAGPTSMCTTGADSGRIGRAEARTDDYGPSTTCPAPRIKVRPDSLCWRIHCSRDSATGRRRCSLIYLQRPSLTRCSFSPATRTTSQQPNLSAGDGPSWMEVPPPDRHDTDGSDRPTGLRLGSSGTVSRAAKVPPPDRQDTDGAVN
jgi:hypothetical protein